MISITLHFAANFEGSQTRILQFEKIQAGNRPISQEPAEQFEQPPGKSSHLLHQAHAQPPLPKLLQQADLFFQCPGEKYPISKAIHLSRLAAFYPKCRDCPHNQMTGNLSPQTVKRLQQTQQARGTAPELFTAEGVRGVYLNQIDRSQAAHIAGAFSHLLWESLPLKGVAPNETRSPRSSQSATEPTRPEKSRGPCVVIGFDERPSSPDIITGVAGALRRNGCRVIDLGLTVPSILSYATTHLQAQGAIMVTGSHSGPSYTGLEFLLEQSQPVSRGFHLERIQEITENGYGRASRQPGSQRTFHPMESYRSQFLKHFHALRPLKIAIACSLRLVRETLDNLFAKLPCQLTWVDIPQQKRNLLDPEDSDVRKLQNFLESQACDLGMLINDDSRQTAFFSESGELLPNHAISQLLMQALAAEQPHAVFVLDQNCREQLTEVPPDWHLHAHQGTLADSYFQMQQHQAVYAGSHTGYHWFRETVPTCDAILTLAHVLAALSFSDAPVSEVLSSSTEETP
ncbi:Phosphomannomutase/phosphoglucomutase [Gimesia panareensis]|uniref:Phosphomannomutase/phosphoglucomutase n=1 Tax=Gimesia panareensis TaxID=2527978 RepID=A0A517QBP3_9PLAN|nr:hypothetical protein [Gimesia panareensis]QDT29052.1 Phosphomannomutase/phosphoglucomutase [Gimesia panareensis]QDV19849.1 Phosphomannomutase/phosphoglucomutase [Gimesia panareensis]